MIMNLAETAAEYRARRSLFTWWRVYHCWTADGGLLYIGQTMDWDLRLSVHKCRSLWWGEVDNVTFSDRLNQVDALAVERACIRYEAPRYNVRHNIKRIAMRLEMAS